MIVRTLLPMLLAFGGLVMQNTALAWPGSDCRFTAQRQAQIDTAGAKSIIIQAGAGDLKVRGHATGTVGAHGKACAPSQSLLEQTNVVVARDGDAIRVSTQMPPEPKSGFGKLWDGGAYIDLEVELPADLPVRIEDSSGDMSVTGIAAGSIRDSSGDIEVEGVNGDLEVSDSSGDTRIGDVNGTLTLEDSSGDLSLRHIRGDVLIKVDSSGDIRVTDAGANVTLDSDGSGDVDIDGVAGNFTLRSKGSGDVAVHGVRGTTSIPDYKK